MSNLLVTTLKSPETVNQFKMALPSHVDPQRFARAALTTVMENADIAKCEPKTVMSCLIQVAQLGLELGKNLGQAYLIPYRNNKTGTYECTLIIGYRGLLSLARRSSQIKRVSANVVYSGDHFEYGMGTVEYLNHRPMGNTAAAAVTHAYAICEFKDGGIQMEVMTRQQIDAIKNRGRQNPVWNSDYAEMARKTALRRLSKMLPLTPELADAFRHDGEDDLALPSQPDPAKYAAATAPDPAEVARMAGREAEAERIAQTREHAAPNAANQGEKSHGKNEESGTSPSN